MRLARILLIHLYTTLQHAIGLKSETFRGVSSFGTRAITVALTSLSNLPLWKKSLIALHTSGPTIFQAALKNFEEKPSGPGAFRSSILNIASFISSDVTALTMCSTSKGLTCLENKLWGSCIGTTGAETPSTASKWFTNAVPT
ncbi:hypothetical protein HanIR_Chr15g0728571 [Helianthus annuus]|nr:hypothetical protein HanIR_Chr17g0903391 [Helianthus annuus]KAJ0453363.1 hypothetical protein HanIR_Chr15g0728571 [Helianthus annuus]